ncbi:MAG: hypothetical protein K2I23_02270 [Clostridia bacterium]|nr:hypothetical protein [Clostridia bacterium]
MKKIKEYDEFGEQFELGLTPANEVEQRLCEEKLKSIGALPEGFVKTGNEIKGFKYYKLVKLDDKQLSMKIKAESVRRLRQIDRHSVTQIVLQSITLGFTALIALCAVVALFLLNK